MSRFAPVAPPDYIRSFYSEPLVGQLLGTYHLLLAHDVVAEPRAYARAFPEQYTMRDDVFIIMDNSLIELGKPVDAKMLYDAQQIVQSEVVVLPDVYGDADTTHELAKKAQEELRNLGYEGDMMYVLQGKRMSEIMQSYRQGEDICPGYFAVPRTMTADVGSRYRVIDYLEMKGVKDVHLLGFSNNLIDDLICANHPIVMGIDSAVPCRISRENSTMFDLLVGRHNQAPRGDWWATVGGVNRLDIENILWTRRAVGEL